jgi:hypothetical protein
VAQHGVVFEGTVAQGVRAAGRIVGVKAIGITYRGHALILRAHVVGELSPDVDAWLARARDSVVAAVSLGRAPEVLVEVVPFLGDEGAIFVDQRVMIGEMAWSVAANAEQARAVFGLAAELDGVEALGSARHGRWEDAVLRVVRQRLPFQPEFQPVTISDGVLTVFEGHYGWCSAHEQGWITTERFSVPCLALPAEPSSAAAFVRKVEEVVARTTEQTGELLPSTECTYCKKTFQPLDFDSHLRACHGCAVAHRGAVY